MNRFLAQRGAVNVGPLLAHDGALEFPTTRVEALVHNVPTSPGAIAYAQVVDVAGLFAFVHKPTLLAVINAEIDAKADDKNALTLEARQQRSGAVQSELLRVERDLSSLIWRGQREGLNIEHGDVSPIAILSCEIITAPARAADGTSVEHGWDIVQPYRP